MATITPDPDTIKKLDALAKLVKKNSLWGKRGFRSEANRVAVAVLYNLVFHPETTVDLESLGLIRNDSTNRPLNS